MHSSHTLDTVCINTHRPSVFEWNRMTVGIHAGFPLLNSVIRLTVYGSADIPAHLSDLRPRSVCVCVHAKISTCSKWSIAPGDVLFHIRTFVCIWVCLNQCLQVSVSTWACSCMLHSLGLGFGTPREGIPSDSDQNRGGSHRWLRTAAKLGRGSDNLQWEWAGDWRGFSKVVETGRPVYLPVIDGAWALCRVQSQKRRRYPRFSSVLVCLRLLAQKQAFHLKRRFIQLSGASSIIRVLGVALITWTARSLPGQY